MTSDRVRSDEKDLDFVRKLVLDTVRGRPGASLANVSRHLGMGQSYLSDYIWYGKPAELPERLRHALARHLRLLEVDLRPPGLLEEPGSGNHQPPPIAPKAAPVAPYGAGTLMADLLEALDGLHREERLELSLQELGLAAWEMHQDIMAAGGDLRPSLERALRARRGHIRAGRAEWLAHESSRRAGETGMSDDPGV